MTREELYEVLVQWGAYQELCEWLAFGDARNVDPHDLVGNIAAAGRGRAAALLYATGSTTNLLDAEYLLDELLTLAAAGQRPRYAAELGDDFLTDLAEAIGTSPSSIANPEGASS